jgi:hypothetical protein
MPRVFGAASGKRRPGFESKGIGRGSSVDYPEKQLAFKSKPFPATADPETRRLRNNHHSF